MAASRVCSAGGGDRFQRWQNVFCGKVECQQAVRTVEQVFELKRRLLCEALEFTEQRVGRFGIAKKRLQSNSASLEVSGCLDCPTGDSGERDPCERTELVDGLFCAGCHRVDGLAGAVTAFYRHSLDIPEVAVELNNRLVGVLLIHGDLENQFIGVCHW